MYKSFAIVCLLYLLITVKPANASMPSCLASGDPWFNETLILNPSTVPQGIEIINDPKTFSHTRLKNNSSRPLYLVSIDKIKPDDESLIASGQYKLVSGETFWFDHFQSTKLDHDIRELKIAKWNKTSEKSIALGESLLLYMGVDVANVYEDNRPQNVHVPSEKPFTFRAYFDEQAINFKGTISYELNKNYDPQAERNGKEECSNRNNLFNNRDYRQMIFPLLVSAVGVTALFSLIYILRRRRRN